MGGMILGGLDEFLMVIAFGLALLRRRIQNNIQDIIAPKENLPVMSQQLTVIML
jgi:hypothetical protein